MTGGGKERALVKSMLAFNSAYDCGCCYSQTACVACVRSAGWLAAVAVTTRSTVQPSEAKQAWRPQHHGKSHCRLVQHNIAQHLRPDVGLVVCKGGAGLGWDGVPLVDDHHARLALRRLRTRAAWVAGGGGGVGGREGVSGGATVGRAPAQGAWDL